MKINAIPFSHCPVHKTHIKIKHMSASELKKQDLNLKNICTVALANKNIYFGSYEFNKTTTGHIHRYNTAENTVKKSTKTSGTFHILKYHQYIIALNKTDISLFSHELDLIFKLETGHMNIFGEIIRNGTINPAENYLFVTADDGSVYIFSLKDASIDLIKKIRVTEGIIWSMKKYKDLIFFGTDNCEMVIYEYKNIFDNPLELKRIKTESAPTFFNTIGDDFFILTYNKFYRFDEQNHVITVLEGVIGGWRFYPLKDVYDSYFVILNDEGCHVFEKGSFKLFRTFKTKSNCYSFLQIDGSVCYSAFYCDTVYFRSIL